MKHLIVVSIDALVYEDLEYARTLPAFSEIMNGAAIIERVRTIYPSLTHPVHATLLTGAPAGVHGIVNNYVHNSANVGSGEWYNHLSDIKCDTLLHAAKRAGLTTAASTWPLTCCGGDVIDYLVPGMMNYYFDTYGGDILSAYRDKGASDAVMPIIEEGIRRFGHLDEHPSVDEFQIFCASEIFKRYKPNLMLIHPGHVDHMRHISGVFSDEVKKAVRLTDEWLSGLISAVKEARLWDRTDIVLLSDHGQINITRSISPNVYLAKEGLISYCDDGRITSYLAFCKSAGASAQVYLAHPDDTALKGRVYDILKSLCDEGVYGISRVFTEKEVRDEFSLFGDFSFVLEGDGYTSFGEWVSPPAVKGYDLADYRFGRATHGHLPTLGPQPTFIGRGPSFRACKTVPTGDILNHAPTLAKLLGTELFDAVGVAVDEILN
ncbi:MAG: alkaline phosphatase family protein [Clostridia bacterium]|nr:alkaline phosphatase family protein [Clostridia bacterium]